VWVSFPRRNGLSGGVSPHGQWNELPVRNTTPITGSEFGNIRDTTVDPMRGEEEGELRDSHRFEVVGVFACGPLHEPE